MQWQLDKASKTQHESHHIWRAVVDLAYTYRFCRDTLDGMGIQMEGQINLGQFPEFQLILFCWIFNNEIVLDLNCNMGNIFTLGFEFENPISLYDLRKGLNRHKRSIILKSISISG